MNEETRHNPELNAIREFLVQCIPFDQLSDRELDAVLPSLEVTYFRRGHVFKPDDDGGLRIVRSGAAELRTESGQLVDRFGEAVSFNLRGLAQEQPDIRATLIEDSLIYLVPEARYQELRKEHREFDRFFHSQRSRRVRRAARREDASSEMTRGIRDIMSQRLITVRPNQSIQFTAQRMTEHRVSSVLVMEGDQLRGIVTDRDLRSRAVAEAIDMSRPIADIMTAAPETLCSDATLFDATLFMTQKGYHHIPVADRDPEAAGESGCCAGKVLGILTSSDLMLARRNDPVHMVQHLGRKRSAAEIKGILSAIPDLLIQWAEAGTRVHQVSHMLTAISDAVTIRLIRLAEEELGPPPAPYCWLGFGSQGREEQLLGGDQDNALVIADSVREQDLEWYRQLSRRVCDGLNECGYKYCPGGIMATTDEWRQPLHNWFETVDRWSRSPTADALMRVSIFFDIRPVYGDEQLGLQLQQHMLRRTRGNSIFLAALAENVLDSPPPLGIFRRFVVEHDGEHRDQLNLKKRAVIPIVDIVRIHALANGLPQVNTFARLKALAESRCMSISDSRNLQDALQVIMQARLEAQAQQLVAGQRTSNYLNPDELSKLVRKQLRDAFGVVKDAQQTVRLRYRPGL